MTIETSVAATPCRHGLGTGCSECEVEKPTGPTSFLAQHKRRPTARQDGIAAWLRDEIEHLKSIERTEFGDGSLFAYKSALYELERP